MARAPVGDPVSTATPDPDQAAHNDGATSDRVGQGRIRRRLAPPSFFWPVFFFGPSFFWTRLGQSAALEHAVEVVLGDVLIAAAVLKQKPGQGRGNQPVLVPLGMLKQKLLHALKQNLRHLCLQADAARLRPYAAGRGVLDAALQVEAFCGHPWEGAPWWRVQYATATRGRSTRAVRGRTMPIRIEIACADGRRLPLGMPPEWAGAAGHQPVKGVLNLWLISPAASCRGRHAGLFCGKTPANLGKSRSKWGKPPLISRAYVLKSGETRSETRRLQRPWVAGNQSPGARPVPFPHRSGPPRDLRVLGPSGWSAWG